jgi:hypothetical protein
MGEFGRERRRGKSRKEKDKAAIRVRVKAIRRKSGGEIRRGKAKKRRMRRPHTAELIRAYGPHSSAYG